MKRYEEFSDDAALESSDQLPIGTQLELGPISPDPLSCDCGGYKTYGSMEPEYHSETLPCSSLKK
jgi:hypothetical protein